MLNKRMVAALALCAGLIVMPACFAFGVEPDKGPGLLFVTLPNVFQKMAWGRLWGSLFFVFMSFAALSTVLAVFENILACTIDFSVMRPCSCCNPLPLLPL